MRITTHGLVRGSMLCAALSAPPAFAQTQAENIAAARALGVQGVTLADQGDCHAAIEKLERAEALYHAPTILGRLGECQVQVGLIVLGTENLNRVVRERLGPDAPEAFRIAQERASRVLEQALPRIARLVLDIQPKGVQARVTVDGSAVPAALIGAERPTDPGEHEIVATADGYLPVRTRVTLAEGGRQELTLTLTPDPAAPRAPGASDPPSTGPALSGASSASLDTGVTTPGSRTNVLPYVLLGVGGVGVITGGVTGLLALSQKNDLECPNEACPPSQHDELDRAKRMALVSTISVGVGLASAAVGTILLLTGERREPSAAIGPVRARPFVSTNGVGVSGQF